MKVPMSSGELSEMPDSLDSVTLPEQLCHVCHNVFEEHGTIEYVAPWLCICQKRIVLAMEYVQQLITHQCKCPVRTLKVSGRRIVYCRCE